jgi:hypothetical protein
VTTPVHRFRTAVTDYIGMVLTPELAAQLEVRAFYEPDRSIPPSRFQPMDYRGLVFAVESLRAIRDEIHPLHEAHWNTTEKARHALGLNPDYEAMERAERYGSMLQFTARREGRLVGNIRMYLYKSTHDSTLAAREDTFFLMPEAREGFNAIRFWQFMELCLTKGLGVRSIKTDTKREHDVGRLNEYLGYTHVSNGYLKIFPEVSP